MTSVPQLVLMAAQDNGVDPELALAVATAESGAWWQNGRDVPDSSAGAIGIMQLEPATAAEMGVNPRDPQQNVDGGVRYLAKLLGTFGDSMAAVAAYDWGEGNVSAAISKYGTPGWSSHVPAETATYLNRIFGDRLRTYQQAAAQNVAWTIPAGVPASSPYFAQPDPASNLQPAEGLAGPALGIAAALALLWFFWEM